MKKTDIIISILGLFYSTISVTEKDQFNDYFDFITFENLSIEESTLFIKQNATLIIAVPIILIFHKEIFKTISEHPYVSAISCYALIHYICDIILDHQYQKELLDLILLIKKIALYLVISHGIKNHIHHTRQFQESNFNEQAFFNTITENLPYTFNEITLIILKSYQELKSNLQKLNELINIESEEFVFLCHASSINLHSLLYLTQNDPEIYKKLYSFEKNPETEFKSLLQYLINEMTINFLKLEQKLLDLQIPTIQKHAYKL